VAEPGRPLGYLFLDKLFQLSIPVPMLNAQRQQAYMRELLHRSSMAKGQTFDKKHGSYRRGLGTL
jgi:hypothetical protein